MSKEISLEEVKKFWPQSAPDINNIKKYVKKYQDEKIVIKYGGNVLIDKDIFNNFIDDINILNKLGCLLYTSPSPRDGLLSRMPSSA